MRTVSQKIRDYKRTDWNRRIMVKKLLDKGLSRTTISHIMLMYFGITMSPQYISDLKRKMKDTTLEKLEEMRDKYQTKTAS